MASSKVLEVLCPNGRRNKVKTSPAMTILEVLQQTCEKFDYDAAEYDLKHQKKILSVTSVMRFLNLANNAKLEMVKLSKPRQESKPVIALQLEDGSRSLNEFSANSTLYDMLVHFQSSWKEDLIKPGVVCVYMRNEYKSMSVLKNTTLKSMGIMGGRAAIRVSYRDDIEEETTLPFTSTARKFENTLQDTNEEPHEKMPKLENTAPPNVGENIIQSTIEQQSRATTTKATTSSSVTPSSSSSSSKLDCDQLFSPPLKSIFPEDANINTSIFPNDNRMPVRPVAVDHHTPQISEFAHFKFPEKSTVDTEDDLAIDPELLRTEMKLSMPCERNAIIYLPEEAVIPKTSENSDGQEGENFFNVTVEDVRKRLQGLTSAKKDAEETMLLTKAMRERRELEKVAAFEKVPIRFQFPSNHILQALFRPLETVKTLKEFLRGYLSEEIKSFEIFTAPPKNILKDNDQTLYRAKLCPASLVYISSSPLAPTLKIEYLDNVKTQSDARLLLEDISKTRTPHDTNTVDTPSFSQTEPRTSRPSLNAGQVNKYDTKPKGAPKWFKSKR